jgi:osmoprotectant transport system substrate-binding protein
VDALTRRAFAVLAVAALSTGLLACGSSGGSSTSSSTVAGEHRPAPAGAGGTGTGGRVGPNEGKRASSDARPVVATTLTPASSGAGVGRPAVTIGDESSPEEAVLGALYAQALAANGFRVTLRENVGPPGVTYRALMSHQIDMYPEYTGTLLSAIAKEDTTPAGAGATYKQAKAFVEKQGLMLLNDTPLNDSLALATQPRYAGEHGLSSIADLQAMGRSLTLGAPPEFDSRADGLLALQREYGADPIFKPIATNRSFRALETGQVDVQVVPSTAGQLLSGKLELLADPKHVFGFQNVAPVARKSVLGAEGSAFAGTLNAVSALLTNEAIEKMNAGVAIDRQSASSVARHFLSAHGLG